MDTDYWKSDGTVSYALFQAIEVDEPLGYHSAQRLLTFRVPNNLSISIETASIFPHRGTSSAFRMSRELCHYLCQIKKTHSTLTVLIPASTERVIDKWSIRLSKK